MCVAEASIEDCKYNQESTSVPGGLADTRTEMLSPTRRDRKWYCSDSGRREHWRGEDRAWPEQHPDATPPTVLRQWSCQTGALVNEYLSRSFVPFVRRFHKLDIC